MIHQPKQHGISTVYMVRDSAGWLVWRNTAGFSLVEQHFASKAIASFAACTAAFYAGLMEFRRIDGDRMDVITVVNETYIYFIAADEHEVVKIGVANHLQERLSTLQTGSPVPLRILTHLAGIPLSLERWLHIQITPQWSHGEWFNQTPMLRRMIDELRLWGDTCGIETPVLGWKSYPKWAHPNQGQSRVQRFRERQRLEKQEKRNA